MPPKSKRRRLNNETVSSTNGELARRAPDRATWPGWCEVESEPAFFNVMLDEMGVRGIKIQEVLGLDDELLAILPKPVHAFIFLFRYREVDKDKQETSCPPDVWFANQMPEFACATVALLNIVNNIPDLNLGLHLQSFKGFTKDLDPISRGDAITNFDFVRRIHNSFAREIDMYNVDLLLKSKHERAQKDKKNAAAREARAASAAEKTAAKRHPLDNEISEDDEGFHFIAYMPIKGSVWKLDGLDSFPQNLGSLSNGDWLSIAKPALEARMAMYSEGQIEFSLMAVVSDPLIEARREFAENVAAIRATEGKLTECDSAWRDLISKEDGVEEALVTGMDIEHGLSDADIAGAAVPPDVQKELQTQASRRKEDVDVTQDLLQLRQRLVRIQAGCRVTVRDRMDADRADADKAMHRRWDYGKFVAEWLRALHDNEALKPLVESVKAGGGE
ncbi:hypothetical protein H2203_007459 [Taxawa tesnikishii (nom. ined.)]|nr:hypothetical protein H2203_007459 [Dothideales sp. JES 119]